MSRTATPEAGDEAFIAIRSAMSEDAAAIAALTREAYAKWIDVIGHEPLPMRVDYAEAQTRIAST